jgi:hypothetical protein
MIYRKTPSQPGRLILRIVATTGAGTLVGAVACGGSTGHGNPGSTASVCGGDGPPCSEVSGSTGSASGSNGPGAGSGVSGSTGSASGGSGAGAGYEFTGAATGYEWAGSLTTSVPPDQGTGDAASSTDASSSDAYAPPDADASPPQAEAGASDATLEAGRTILGISVAPPDAGSEP